jgi:hypothetical protein
VLPEYIWGKYIWGENIFPPGKYILWENIFPPGKYICWKYIAGPLDQRHQPRLDDAVGLSGKSTRSVD